MKRSSSSSGPSAHVVSSAGGVLVILRSMLSSVLRFRRVKISFRKGVSDLRTALPSTRRSIDAGSHFGEVNTVVAQVNDIEEEPLSREELGIA